MECQYCHKIFKFGSTLLHHQKTAKYCIEKQGKNNTNFKCEFCSKILTTNNRLLTHLEICKKKLKSDCIKEKEEYYKKQLDEKEEYHKKQLKKQLDEKEEKYQDELRTKDNLLIQLREREKQKDEYIKELKQSLNKANQTIAEIAKQSKTTNNNSDSDEELPLTVREKIDDAIDTIDVIDKEEVFTVSTVTLNNVVITSRHPDHYVNATELCQAGGKKFNDWNRLDTTKDLINQLESDTGITASLLVESKRGQTSKFKQGSWIHPDLAIQLAQWISPSFALQVSRWVRSLFDRGTIEIDIALLKDQEKQLLMKEQRIKQLEDICLSKQRRIEYPEKNVIYILTTDDHIKRRTYIIGKAKNLTTRLGTYNKTCDHKVVYYRECKNEDDMTIIENLVLSKLKDYREQANRDRFILPEDKEVSFFISTIDECVNFV